MQFHYVAIDIFDVPAATMVETMRLPQKRARGGDIFAHAAVLASQSPTVWNCNIGEHLDWPLLCLHRSRIVP